MKLIIIFIILLPLNIFAEASIDAFDQELDHELTELNREFIANNSTGSMSIRVLNKISAKTQNISLKVGSFVKIGNLEIHAKKCWYQNPEDQDEEIALLKIMEQEQDSKNEIFYGWIFANSPALSSLEHPVYDITLIKCEK